ncbi:MAG: Ig-like domain-containing protein [Oscillospiraceae bacterium]|nr:Ig-like domain-containing protein [Oscillospiraceae bacterium]MDD7292307.1 Ig-like domain-containing protein [Clostridiaceae bacterium]MDY5990807.1 Ig-like domain-containing protein [Oscillospiraceae bacterium]
MQSITKRLLAVISAVILMTTMLIPAFQASAASVKLNKTKIVLVVGQTYNLKVSGTKKTPQWSSSNKKIVSVTKKGVVKGLRKGTATITAKIGKKTYKCKVTVESPKLSSTKKTVTAGTSFTLKLNGTKQTVKWYTSNKKIATVSKKGVVKTLRAGSVKITAKVGGKSYVCRVTVKAKPAAPVVSEKNKAAAQYNALINNLKKEKNITVYREEKLNMKPQISKTMLELFKKILGDDVKELAEGINEQSKATRRFTDGKAPAGDQYITLNAYIPPEGRAAALQGKYIKSAKTVKNADGGYTLTVALISETSKYDGKKFSATPANNSICDSSLGTADFGMDDMQMDIKLALTGTTVQATVGANGKLSKLQINMPMKMSASFGLFDIAFVGTATELLTFTY